MKRLNLFENRICFEGVKALAESLKVNTSLTSLTLGCNFVRDDGAKEISEALRVNTTLRSLNLYETEISDEGCRFIIDSLKMNNTTLMNIRLDWNNEEAIQYLLRNKKLHWKIKLATLKRFKMIPDDMIHLIFTFLDIRVDSEYEEEEEF